MDGKNVGLIVTVVLAFITLIAKYFNDMAFARRKDRFERINLQLRNLYGPLYAIDHATNIAWNAFRSRCRPNVPYFTEDFLRLRRISQHGDCGCLRSSCQ